MSTKNTDLDQLMSTNELVEYVNKKTGATIPKSDIKVIEKSFITGFTLVQFGTDEDFEKEGLSWGTRKTLLKLKQDFLKKRTSYQAGLAQPEESERGAKRIHIQEGSGDTTDSQNNIEKRREYVTQNVEAAPQNSPALAHIAKLSKERRQQIMDHFRLTYKNWDDAKAGLSSPDVSVDLPFPFLGTAIPKRFTARGDDEENFQYMGREVFSGLVDAFKMVTRKRCFQDLWLYGLTGYGKSHLLATLTCFLTAQGYRVIYLPDCRVCHRIPVRYLQESLLFTWADIPEKVNAIVKLRDMNGVEDFIMENWSTSVIFVIDQLNALDGEEESKTKTEVRRWLNRCRADMKTVLSTSANNMSFHQTTHRQNNDYLFIVSGGFTRGEMNNWWSRHSAVALGDYTRNDVEDYTGRNPLLLESCTEQGKVDFQCKEILHVVRQAQRFTHRMKNKLKEWEWSKYLSYVKSCIACEFVPEDIAPEHVDHRFFHEKDRYGYSICGAVRDAVTKELGYLGTYLFSIEESIEAMSWLISNPSVVRYFLRQAIIQSIVSTGIKYLDMPGPMPQLVFRDFPTYNLAHERALYVPKSFNFPAIDALILRLNTRKMEAEILPVRITIQKSHKNSEDQFFKDWEVLRRYLHDYKITVTFLWITADGAFGRASTSHRIHDLRSGSTKLVWPIYDSVQIPIKEVNEKIWRRYEEAKAKPELLASN